MRITLPILIASAMGLTSPLLASPGEQEASVVLVAWSEAYASRDHVGMARLHQADARLRGMDNATHLGREAIKEFYYFEGERAQAQSVTFTSQTCQTFNDGNFKDYLTAVCAGTYELKQVLRSGETRVRPAQFRMALVPENNLWVIYDHVTTWLPAVVADCGTSIPPEKLTVGSSTSNPNLSSVCGEVAKPSSAVPIPAATSAIIPTE
jgi:hypothetical protein